MLLPFLLKLYVYQIIIDLKAEYHRKEREIEFAQLKEQPELFEQTEPIYVPYSSKKVIRCRICGFTGFDTDFVSWQYHKGKCKNCKDIIEEAKPIAFKELSPEISIPHTSSINSSNVCKFCGKQLVTSYGKYGKYKTCPNGCK